MGMAQRTSFRGGRLALLFSIFLLTPLTLPAIQGGPDSPADFTSDPSKPETVSVYLPSPIPVVEKMLEVARIQPNERVYDLGSGDGRVVIMAAQKYGARGVGIEINPQLCRLARSRVEELGLKRQVTIIEDSFFNHDLGVADVVTVYLDPRGMERVKKYLESFLHHGLRVVACESEIPGWTPTTTAKALDKDTNRTFTIFLYEISRPGDWTSFGTFGQPGRSRPSAHPTPPRKEQNPR